MSLVGFIVACDIREFAFRGSVFAYTASCISLHFINIPRLNPAFYLLKPFSVWQFKISCFSRAEQFESTHPCAFKVAHLQLLHFLADSLHHLLLFPVKRTGQSVYVCVWLVIHLRAWHTHTHTQTDKEESC